MKSKTQEIILLNDLEQEFVDVIQETGIVALDCEMTGLNPHRDLLCLVQLCDVQQRVRIVKTQNWRKVPHLAQILEDDKIIKVFHFAIMDCGFLMKNVGVEVANAYCTKIASKLVRTYTEEHGLSSLAKELLQIDMDKSQQSTFWLADELTTKQLKYAANDVLYLLELRELLEEMLIQKGELSTNISYQSLNRRCQAFIPTLTQLWVNGWDFGRQERAAVNIFGR